MRFPFKLGELTYKMNYDIMYEGKIVEEYRGTACFAAAMRTCKGNDRVDTLRLYPWIKLTDKLDMEKWVPVWLDILLSVPFVQRCVKQYNGVEYVSTAGPLKVDRNLYVDIALKAPMDESYVTMKLFRIPQERPGNIHVFATLVEDGCEPFTAWLASLYYSDDHYKGVLGEAHSATKYIDLEWCQKFLDDPSIAKSSGNGWNTTVFCPNGTSDMDIDTFLKGIRNKDVPRHSIAVYGTLKAGMRNHYLLEEAIKSGAVLMTRESVVQGDFTLYDTGYGFPAVVPEGNSHVYVELYKVSDSCLASLDELEGYPKLFNRAEVLTDSGEVAWLYYQPTANDGYKKIANGNWS